MQVALQLQVALLVEAHSWIVKVVTGYIFSRNMYTQKYSIKKNEWLYQAEI